MTGRLLRHAAAAAVLALVAGACSKSPTSPGDGNGNGNGNVTVTALTVSGNASLPAGGTSQLTATATMSDGSDRNVTSQATWTSANDSVATVNASGLVTAVSTGSAQIIAVYEGQSAQRGVNIAAPVFAFRVESQAVTAIGTCDDFTQGSGHGEFAIQVNIIRTGASTLVVDETQAYPGDPDDLRGLSLAPNASLSLNGLRTFNFAGSTGQSVRVEFRATEWDEQIVIIPPSIRWVREGDMNNRSASTTHAFNNGAFGSLGNRTLTIGNQSCGIRYQYSISATAQ